MSAGFEAFEERRTDAYAAALEARLRAHLVDGYARRAGEFWKRDYTSVEAYLRSVEPGRQGWRRVVRPPDLARTGPARREGHPPLEEVRAEWLAVPLDGLTAEGALAIPDSAAPDKPAPLVIAQHGIGSYPERNFGILDKGDLYHGYARRLLEAGFAVLAPMNLRTIERRNRVERLCRLAGWTLPGIELVRMQRLLDEALADPRVDAGRVGMWGLSLGGLSTMFWTPLEPRINVAVVAGWFNHRRHKMAVTDKRYSCFLDTTEEWSFYDGWLTAYTDADVASLICPRPLMIQTGKKDPIAWWPMVEEEFDAAKEHYRRLGMADRIELDLRDGGHETHVGSGLRFLSRWLTGDAGAGKREGPTP